MHAAVRLQCLEQRGPIEREIYRDEQKIKRIGCLEDLGAIAARNYAMRPELPRFVSLRRVRRKSGHFAAPCIGELKSEMAKAADTHHANAICWLDPECNQRRKHRNTPAQQWASGRNIERIGQWNRPQPMRANPIRKTSMAPHNC